MGTAEIIICSFIGGTIIICNLSTLIFLLVESIKKKHK